MQYIAKIKGFESYTITREGKVYSSKAKRFLKTIGKPNWYHDVVLSENGIRQAAQELGVVHSAIGNCLTGRSKSAAGYTWKYI